MSQYQLPCEKCGSSIPVSLTMAGSLVTCSACGHSQKAPKLGTLRGLVPMAGAQPPTTPQREWTAANGLLFTAGFVLLLVGVVGSWICYQRYLGHQAAIMEINPEGQLPDYSDLSRFEARASALPVDMLWMEWREALKDTLGEWNPTRLRYLLDLREEAYLWFVGYCVTTGVGLVMAVSGFAVSFGGRKPTHVRGRK